MAITINAKTSGAGGLETTADNTGNINIQSGGSTVMSVTSSGVAITGALSQNGGVYSTQPTFRNRIINGDMRIAQRGTSFSNPTGGLYTLDRWYIRTQNASVVSTITQSTTAPTGFINSFYLSIGTGAASGSTDRAQLYHGMEGLNVSDFGWGTANAKTVTLSFWVRSSLTGQFGGAIQNSAGNRSYPFTYTISSANTWEQKTVTVAGDTTGTWTTDNGLGVQLNFDLGAGSSFLTTAGSWAAGDYRGATGDTSIVATSGATWYITGIQLEVGSTATDFENLPYDVELARCQRYYYKSMQGTPANNIPTSDFLSSSGYNGYTMFTNTEGRSEYFQHPVQMRASPTVTIYSSNRANTAGKLAILIGSWVATTVSTPVADFNRLAFDITSPTSGVAGYSYLMAGGFDASAEL